MRVRRLLPGHGEAGWPEAGAAAAIVLYVLYRREWVRVRRLLPGHGEAGWPVAGACCSYCTVYMYCIGESG